jgi:hypothetical protein
MTTSLKTRVSFVVCVDSTTYAETFTAIYSKLDLVANHLIEEGWKRQDESKQYTKNYQEKVEYKRKRSDNHKKQIQLT